MMKDEEKRSVCKQKGITLIEVPFSWDGSKEELALMIFEQRKDIQLTFDEHMKQSAKLKEIKHK